MHSLASGLTPTARRPPAVRSRSNVRDRPTLLPLPFPSPHLHLRRSPEPSWPFTCRRSRLMPPPCPSATTSGGSSFPELTSAADFAAVASPAGRLSVVGFGSLLSERSARSTFPELEGFRVAVLRGFRRVFAHAAPIFFERGIAIEATKEFSSLSVEPCEGELIVVTVFEIKEEEVPAFIEREHEFRFLGVVPEGLDGVPFPVRSIAATLSSPRGEPDSDADESEPPSADSAAPEESSPRNLNLNPDAEEPEEPDTPSRGVKDDISELTETLTRRLWGVASFLAPPPPESSTPRAAAGAEGEEEGKEEDRDGDGEDAAQSPRIAGIRSDLAEIGGRVRSGISMLQSNSAVAGISKIASSLLPFGQGEADEGEPVAGVTEEVVVFVRHISTRPETWLDFPLFIRERYADDFELSDAQYVHALGIEHLVPSLSDLRTALCSTDMSEACFWKIYFVLLHSKLNKQDAELLSTPQILEAREELLQSLKAKNKRGSDVPVESSNVNVPSAPAEERVIQPLSIQSKAGTSEVSSFEEPTSDIAVDVEAEKFPIATTEVEIIDKSVIEEELSVKNESKSLPMEPKLNVESLETGEDEVDEWPDDDTAEVVGTAGNRTSLGQEEDVSFSDLEDDDEYDDDGYLLKVRSRHNHLDPTVP